MLKPIALLSITVCAVTLWAERDASLSPESSFEKQLGADQAVLHVLNRLTFGPRPGDVETVKTLGIPQWIDQQLHPEHVPHNEALDSLTKVLVEPSTPAAVVRFSKIRAQSDAQRLISEEQLTTLRDGTNEQALGLLTILAPETAVRVLSQLPSVRDRLLPLMPPDLRKNVIAGVQTTVPQPGQTLAQAKLFRAIQSDRQLEEVLVDFWYNHFNVDAGKGADWYMVTGYENNAIRPHVLGKFRDLLEATANSPAMMFYLDNWESRANSSSAGLNENYARELMELHTMGVNGGYTQRDIVEVARCFTGWTIENPTTGGKFRYDDQLHDPGEKIVLGVTIPAGGGKNDGEKVLDILAHHPSTARFVSRKLAQRFVADDPPPALIDRMANTFRETDGDIRATLATLFASREFLSEGAYRAKLKTPFETVVSAVRAVGGTVSNAAYLARQVSALGEPLYRKLEPTGYSSLATDWTSSAGLMARMNFAMDLAQNQVAGVEVDSVKFAGTPAAAAYQILFTAGDPRTLEAIAKAIPTDTKTPGASAAGMLLGSPEFQRK